MDDYDRAVAALRRDDVAEARDLLLGLDRDARAYLLLGQLASAGNGEPADPAKAARLYERAADLGSADAAYNLGAFHATGRGVAQDYGTARTWYGRAAELGDTDALDTLARMHLNGEGGPVDLEAAAACWCRAADAGHVTAAWELGHLYSYRKDDPTRAAHWYMEAAKKGHQPADELRRLEPGLRALADAGDTGARTMLGVALAFLLGDREAAVGLLEQSAVEGDPVAQRTLGYLIEHGSAPDPDRAAQLYRAAAEAGDGIAAYNVGISATDADEAIHWLGRAADAGVGQAHPRLAHRLTAAGRDVDALRHFVRGAETGDVRCMFEAAGRYRDGRGTPVDLVQTLRWYLAMLNQGNGDGIHEAHQIVDRMTDEQIDEAGRQSGRASEAETFITVRRH